MLMLSGDPSLSEYMRDAVVSTVGLKRTGNRCSGGGARGRCRLVELIGALVHSSL